MSIYYHIYYEYITHKVLTPFYEKRLKSLSDLTLDKILKAKNPYLFRAKNIEIAGDLVRSIIDAHLSSQEETIFGNLLEGFAIHVAENLYKGFKRTPPLKSVDLEFERDGVYYIVGIKSGTVWGNSDQIRAMLNHFVIAKLFLREQGVTSEIVAINGCMYGTEPNPLKNTINRGAVLQEEDRIYYEYAGQEFWHFISEDADLYQEIVIPIAEAAKGRDIVFKTTYIGKINKMTEDFMERFLTSDKTQIDWTKLIDFVSKKR